MNKICITIQRQCMLHVILYLVIVLILSCTSATHNMYPAGSSASPELNTSTNTNPSEEALNNLASLVENFDPKKEKNRTTTALMKVAMNGNTLYIIQLINKGANRNFQDNQGRTALMHAMINRHTEATNLLIDYKVDVNVDVNIQDDEGRTALMHTAIIGDETTLNKLMEFRNTLNLQDEDMKKLLIKGIRLQDTQGRTATMLAAINGHDNIVQCLIKHEDFTLEDNNHEQVSHFIAQYCNEETLEVLNYNLRNHILSAEENEPIELEHLRNIISRNFLIRAVSNEKTTKFVKFHKDSMLYWHPGWAYRKKYLLENIDKDNNTAFHHAIMNQNKRCGLESIKLLIKNIKDFSEKNTLKEYLNIKDQKGDTPLMLAIKENFTDAVSCLVKYNVDVFAYKQALVKSNADIVKIFLEDLWLKKKKKKIKKGEIIEWVTNMLSLLKEEETSKETNEITSLLQQYLNRATTQRSCSIV